MDPLQTLNRTFDPKLSRYSPDGWGRDTYIAHDNGGLVPRPLPLAGGRRQMVFSSFRTSRPSPKRESTAFKYTSDGSGRDFYITCAVDSVNSGGLHPSYQPGGKADVFKQSLRSDQRRTFVPMDDFFTRTNQSWVSVSGRGVRLKRMRVLSEVTSRLYTAQVSPTCSRSPPPGKARRHLK